jgi:tetratricopeptide (TPR) repeat protein
MLAEPVLVGRLNQIKKLQQCLENALEGHGSTIFISGEAGSGKTRLTTEFLNIAKQKNVQVLSGWCLSNAGEPYFPFADAFNSFCSQNADDSLFSEQLELHALIDGSSEKLRRGSSTALALKDQTLAAITQKFMQIATKKPLILFIDDVHWADSASLALLHYLSRSIGSERILVIATYRCEELSSQHGDCSHPLLEVLRLLGREGILLEIGLQRLSIEDVTKIIESMLGSPVDSSFVQRIAHDSLGNPLFVVESIRMLYEQNRLWKNGFWKLIGENLTIPPKVKEVIMRRVESLKPIHRRLLQAASVIGEKFNPELVAKVLSQDSLEIVEALDAIASATHLVSCQNDDYVFDHSKSREMLYENLSSTLKKRYHLRIAQQTLEMHGENASLTDLAFHFSRSGQKENAIKYSLAAGNHALSRYSNLEARRYFSYVLETISDDDNNSEHKIAALEGLGDALYANSMFTNAIEIYESLGKIALGVIKLRAYRKAMESAFFQNNIPHLVALISEAERYTSTDRVENARVLLNRGRVFLMYEDKPLTSLKEQEEALRVFKEELSLWDIAWALLGVGSHMPYLGQLVKGLAAELEAIALFEEIGDLRWQARAKIRASMILSTASLNQEALRFCNEAIKTFEKIGDFSMLAEVHASIAIALEDANDLEASLKESMVALDCCKKTDSNWAISMTQASLVRVRTKLGKITEAKENYDILQKLPAASLLMPMVRKTSTDIIFFAGQKRFNQANTCLNKYIDGHPETLNTMWNARFKKDIAWLLDQQGKTREANFQLSESLAIMSKIRVRFEDLSVESDALVAFKNFVGISTEWRFIVINNSAQKCFLSSIENLPLTKFKVIECPSEYCLHDSVLSLKGQELAPFTAKVIKINVQPLIVGSYIFIPKISFFDIFGIKIISDLNRITVEVKESPSATVKAEVSTTISTGALSIVAAQLEFETDLARKAFDYLADSFVKDYMRRKLTLENSGWCTLMELVKKSGVPMRSVYGAGSKRTGVALAELERRGLVEVRVFVGERGRGGRILKARIAYGKEPVKRQVDIMVAKLNQK